MFNGFKLSFVVAKMEDFLYYKNNTHFIEILQNTERHYSLFAIFTI